MLSSIPIISECVSVCVFVCLFVCLFIYGGKTVRGIGLKTPGGDTYISGACSEIESKFAGALLLP